MWPEIPSVKPTRAQLRNAAAICTTICLRCSWKEVNVGMPVGFSVIEAFILQ